MTPSPDRQTHHVVAYADRAAAGARIAAALLDQLGAEYERTDGGPLLEAFAVTLRRHARHYRLFAEGLETAGPRAAQRPEPLLHLLPRVDE
jgi:hypothetical protein